MESNAPLDFKIEKNVVGFAVGIADIDVTKRDAHTILMDENFLPVIKPTIWSHKKL